jgi:hypothetical protein
MHKRGNAGRARGLWVNLSAIIKRFHTDWAGDHSGRQDLLARLGRKRGGHKEWELERILDMAGLDHALTAAGAVRGYREAMRLFACRCAGAALHFFELRYPGRTRLREAVGTAEHYALGEAGPEELRQAGEEVKAICRAVVAERGPGPWYLLEELYDPMNAAARCVDRAQYTYRRSKFQADDLGLIFRFALNSIRSFVVYSMGEEDTAANAALNEQNRSETLFTTYYIIRHLHDAGEAIEKASREVALSLSGKAAGVLREHGLCAPDGLEIHAGYAIKNVVFQAVLHSMQNAAGEAIRANLADEFQRLCRLEGEYGKAAARETARGME